ncbi:MAG: hypothetical protein MSQ05_10190 [Akkermansia sp.]|nr:hypothetical protein [Akkermansia sp.]
MYVAVLLGHLVALLFAFCGVVNLFYLDFSQEMGAHAFFVQLAQAAWPLAVGTGLYVLVQAAMLLERLVIVSENPAVPEAEKKSARSEGKKSSRAEAALQPGPLPAAQVVRRPFGDAAQPSSVSSARPAAVQAHAPEGAPVAVPQPVVTTPPVLPAAPEEKKQAEVPSPEKNKVPEPPAEQGPRFFKLN